MLFSLTTSQRDTKEKRRDQSGMIALWPGKMAFN